MMLNEQQAYEALDKLTNDEKYKNLPSEAKQQALFGLAKGVNADTTGSTTVFYSGIDDKIVNHLSKNPNLRMIRNTDVGKFLDSGGFKVAFYDTIGINYSDILDKELSPTQQSAIKNLNSSTLYHPTQGMWADASRRFAEQSKDKAIALVGK